MSTNDLFLNLLRPAVLHILRATGFHYGKPSAVDTIVDLTARYLLLLAERTAYNAYSNHNDATPNITDVRMALQDCALLVPTMTAGEEAWKEILRKPLSFYNGESGARDMEEKRRDAEDTVDVKEFIDWVKGPQNKEIMRIAGTYKPVATNPTEQLDQLEMEDYLNTLMKKHSKTGVESRFQGTVLGASAEPKTVKIEGGSVDTLEEWCRRTREQAAAKAAESKRDIQDISVDHDTMDTTDAHNVLEVSEEPEVSGSPQERNNLEPQSSGTESISAQDGPVENEVVMQEAIETSSKTEPRELSPDLVMD